MGLSPELAAKKDQLIADEHAEEIEQSERQAAKERLGQPHTEPHSVPELWARLKELERMHGIKEQ